MILMCMIALSFALACALCLVIADEYASRAADLPSVAAVMWSLAALGFLCAAVAVLSTLWWL